MCVQSAIVSWVNHVPTYSRDCIKGSNMSVKRIDFSVTICEVST